MEHAVERYLASRKALGFDPASYFYLTRFWVKFLGNKQSGDRAVMGFVNAIDHSARTIDIKRTQPSRDHDPSAVMVDQYIAADAPELSCRPRGKTQNRVTCWSGMGRVVVWTGAGQEAEHPPPEQPH